MIRKAWLTTSWDDGHPLDFKIADMLSRFGLTGTFYIPHSAPNITMSREQIRDLGSAFEIGSHTINHVFLDGATDEQARTEIIDSKAWVQDVMGKPCPMFCPPGGKFADRDIKLIREAGYSGSNWCRLIIPAIWAADCNCCPRRSTPFLSPRVPISKTLSNAADREICGTSSSAVIR
jgi:peptidoglycan/xylan/chitin deacetylase (PgdA/CDA1 family)